MPDVVVVVVVLLIVVVVVVVGWRGHRGHVAILEVVLLLAEGGSQRKLH